MNVLHHRFALQGRVQGLKLLLLLIPVEVDVASGRGERRGWRVGVSGCRSSRIVQNSLLVVVQLQVLLQLQMGLLNVLIGMRRRWISDLIFIKISAWRHTKLL